MNTILQTSVFKEWLAGLKDIKARAAILVRIDRAVLGNFGDCAPVEQGVFEMRVHSGPGYRLYCVRRGKTLYLLLCGGNKRTQKADIKRAKELARTL
ncbi:MAG: type II toxin-antitoxin system RelE/ParE family toxin [Proteobacteria bacterium]|nr:type II toxin-antitoxin system RelE/ParE family toxin [Pseudomonadota bacterium]